MLPAFREDVYLGTTVHSNVEWMDGFDESTVSSEGTWVDLTEYYFSRGHHVIVAKPFRTATSKRAQQPLESFYKAFPTYGAVPEDLHSFMRKNEPSAYAVVSITPSHGMLSMWTMNYKDMVKDDLLKIRGRLIKQGDKVCYARLFLVSCFLLKICSSGGIGNRVLAAFRGFSPTPC